MKKFSDTVTEIGSQVIIDEKYNGLNFALKKSDKLSVVFILDVNQPNNIVTSVSLNYREYSNTIYTMNEIVISTEYDPIRRVTNNQKILHFQTIESAYYIGRSIPSNYNGLWFQFDLNHQYMFKVEFGQVVNGNKTGKWIYYDEKGNKAGGEYINNMRNGKWIYYHKNGNTSIECEYLDDNLCGKIFGWYAEADGQKQFEGEYLNGEKNGVWTYWYKNGKISELKNYSNGKLNGKYIQWNESGIKTIDKIMKNVSCIDLF
jgi:antitoxin component YwqK of YwqJK toxin-antitoxin module